MPHIVLAVTQKVLRQVNDGNLSQRQIAIRDASHDLHILIQTARASNRVPVAVNGVFELSVGDTGAIWATHQAEGIQSEDFMSLYDLLARRSEVGVRFAW